MSLTKQIAQKGKLSKERKRDKLWPLQVDGGGCWSSTSLPKNAIFFTIFWLLIYFFALAHIYVREQKNSVSRHGFPIKSTAADSAAELSKMNFASVGSFPTHNVEKLSKHLQNKFGPTTFCMSVIVFSRAMLQSGTKWLIDLSSKCMFYHFTCSIIWDMVFWALADN